MSKEGVPVPIRVIRTDIPALPGNPAVRVFCHECQKVLYEAEAHTQITEIVADMAAISHLMAYKVREHVTEVIFPRHKGGDDA